MTAYLLCPMCGKPTYYGDFLPAHQGYHLDLIKVCCKNCVEQFEALPEGEQLSLLHQAMVKTYSEKAFIYGLHYDDSRGNIRYWKNKTSFETYGREPTNSVQGH